MGSKTKPTALKRTAVLGAWMSERMGPQDLDTDACVSRLSYFRQGKDSDEDYWRSSGYTKVGEATISVALVSQKELVTAKVSSLKAELQKTRADAEVKCNRLAEQIGKLEALEWNGANHG